MQILPTQHSTLLGFIPTELFANVQQAVTQANFSDLLAMHPVESALASSSPSSKATSELPVNEVAKNAVDAVPQAPLVVVPAAALATPQVAAPQVAALQAAAAKPGEAPGLEAMSQVKMSQEDFSRVRVKLEQAGVSKEKLDDMQKRVASPEGYTWGQFVQGLRETVRASLMPKVDLSSIDKANLSSLFSRLGFDAKQSGELAEGLANGETAKVWKQISAKLASMDPKATVNIPADEAQSLFKGLRLPAAAQERLTAQFSQLTGKELSPAVLTEAFKSVKGEMDAQFTQIHDAMKQLREAVEPVMVQAQDRVKTAKQATDGMAASQQVKVSSLLKEPEQAASTSQGASDSQKPQTNPSVQPGAQATDPNAKNAQRDPGAFQNPGKNGQEQHSSQEKAWNEFFGKVRVEGDPSSRMGAQTPDSAFASLAAKGTQASAVLQGKAGEAGLSRTQSQQFFDQVESGLLRNLGQGTRQMTLELTPDNLGKLNVVLTVKGKEVHALIKTETPEASKLLGDNIAQLKDSLERQGLTVAKLEVQTGLAQDTNLGQQWAGANQHNMAQERRDALDRMRSSSSLLGGVSGLAQEMQNTGVQVKNSQGGVDLIA